MNLDHHWYILAMLYHERELSLPQIVWQWTINTVIGAGGVEGESINDIGVYIADRTALNNALVYGILKEYPEGMLISYPEIARMLLLHHQTVGKAINRLIADGWITRQDFGASGSTYKICDLASYPKWLMCFTAAIVQITYDEELQARITAECERLRFGRGIQLIKSRLNQKFYRRKLTPKSP